MKQELGKAISRDRKSAVCWGRGSWKGSFPSSVGEAGSQYMAWRRSHNVVNKYLLGTEGENPCSFADNSMFCFTSEEQRFKVNCRMP